MKGIILAAGRGSRMKEMTKEIPKCLIEIDGQTLLSKQINAFKSNGISDIYVVTGYKSNLIKNYLKNKSCSSVYNKDWQLTNMVYSLSLAKEILFKHDCIVSYSDIFFPDEAISILKKCNNKISILYDVNWKQLWGKRFENPLDDAETFKITDNGFVKEIGNKPKNYDEIEGQFMGLLKFTPKIWNIIDSLFSELDIKVFKKLQMTHLLQDLLVKEKIDIKAYQFDGKWGELDNIKDYKIYSNIL